MHFTRLKEKHAELVSRHADLMRKVETHVRSLKYEGLSGFRPCFTALQNAEMVKQTSSTQQAQEELVTARQQIEHLRQDNSAAVNPTFTIFILSDISLYSQTDFICFVLFSWRHREQRSNGSRTSYRPKELKSHNSIMLCRAKRRYWHVCVHVNVSIIQ